MESFSLSLPSAAPLSLPLLLLNLAIGAVLSLVLRWHYERFGASLSNRREFAQIFPFIVLTTVLIITVVKSSLALSLGLVGALSIVRFRTPIKEPEELAYLFIAIAMGLGLGADQTLPTVVASAAILALVSGVRWARRRRGEPRNFFLALDWAGERAEAGEPLAAIHQVVSRHCDVGDLRRVDRRESGLEVTYLVDVAEAGRLSALMEDLDRAFPGIGVSLIDQRQVSGF